jgi:glycosyltransferase involved in cell wall biosynthesis
MEVSVVIPVYDAARYVEEAVASALAQPETREVVIVEDGSRDESLAVCTRLRTADQRVLVHRHRWGANRGPAASRNLGISRARSDLVAFLDADDVFLPERFRCSAELLTDAGIDGVYEAVGVQFEDTAAEAWWRSRGGPDLHTLPERVSPERLFEALVPRLAGSIHTSGVVVRRRLLARVGPFDRGLLYGEDVGMWVRMAALGRLAGGSLETPVSLRRVHLGSLVARQGRSKWEDVAKSYYRLARWATAHSLPAERLAVLVTTWAWSHRQVIRGLSRGPRRKLLDLRYAVRLGSYFRRVLLTTPELRRDMRRAAGMLASS